MTAPVRAVEEAVEEVVEEAVEEAAAAVEEAVEEAVEAPVRAAAVEALAVLPSQGHLFAAALPLPVRLPRSAQRLPLRLYLLPWPPVWLALLRAW